LLGWFSGGSGHDFRAREGRIQRHPPLTHTLCLPGLGLGGEDKGTARWRSRRSTTVTHLAGFRAPLADCTRLLWAEEWLSPRGGTGPLLRRKRSR